LLDKPYQLLGLNDIGRGMSEHEILNRIYHENTATFLSARSHGCSLILSLWLNNGALLTAGYVKKFLPLR
jgi:hypothetical protein